MYEKGIQLAIIGGWMGMSQKVQEGRRLYIVLIFELDICELMNTVLCLPSVGSI